MSNLSKFLMSFEDSGNKSSKSDDEIKSEGKKVQLPVKHLVQLDDPSNVLEQEKHQEGALNNHQKHGIIVEIHKPNVEEKSFKNKEETEKQVVKLRLSCQQHQHDSSKCDEDLALKQQQPQIHCEEQYDVPANQESRIPQSDQNKEPKLTGNVKNINCEQSKDLHQEQIESMFAKSGTPVEFKQNWIDLLNKAEESQRRTMTNQKIREGKFRFNDKCVMEILPDHPIEGKSSGQLLHEIWF